MPAGRNEIPQPVATMTEVTNPAMKPDRPAAVATLMPLISVSGLSEIITGSSFISFRNYASRL